MQTPLGQDLLGNGYSSATFACLRGSLKMGSRNLDSDVIIYFAESAKLIITSLSSISAKSYVKIVN